MRQSCVLSTHSGTLKQDSKKEVASVATHTLPYAHTHTHASANRRHACEYADTLVPAHSRAPQTTIIITIPVPNEYMHSTHTHTHTHTKRTRIQFRQTASSSEPAFCRRRRRRRNSKVLHTKQMLHGVACCACVCVLSGRADGCVLPGSIQVLEITRCKL